MAFEWIDDAEALDAAIAAALEDDRYALDTEFHRERTYHPHLALVQLAAAGRLWLIDALAVDVAPLKQLLLSDGLALVHACSQDLEILELATGAIPKRLFDPQVAAGFVGQRQASLGHLLEAHLSVHLKKGDQLTDWTRRPLPDSALAYAASDVEHLHALHDALVAKLGARLTWAEEEIERVRQVPRGPRDPETAWWKLKGHGKLRGERRKVAQAVAAWRERRAAKLDRPVKRVLGDLALLSIVNRPPRDARQLRKARGIGRLDGGTERALLAAIERGRNMADDEVVMPAREDTGNAPGAAVALCQAWVAAVADREKIDPSVLANRKDVAALVAGKKSRLDDGWRRELVGQDLRALLAGQRAITWIGGKVALVDARGSGA